MLILRFIDPGERVDADLSLVLDTFHHTPTIASDRTFVPWYRFRMVHTRLGITMGNISLRLGNTRHVLMYAGHIGYGVDPLYRGHRYAARAVTLLLPHALSHGINPIWITCNPDNAASRRTCEIAGGRLMEIVNIPEDDAMYRAGERQKCRYRFDLVPAPAAKL